jgi:catechol 2,3-dioxygenase-like lactoylglutathione lyase family enzyme
VLDHVILAVSDLDRAVDFYTATLAPLGITVRADYAGKDGPPGHPDLRGLGADGRLIVWLRHGVPGGAAVRIGFVADGAAQVDAAYAAAMAAGATDDGPPAARTYYDPRYYAANVFDPDGYSLEFVYKSWQH